MKTILTTLALTLTATLAHADGFVCQTESGLNIKVYDHTSPAAGTRNAAIMVISDANVGLGNKTIASFSDVKNTLSSKNEVYTARVDLRVSESNRRGENISGTKLGYLKELNLIVDFSYAQPLEDGERTSATLVLLKRDGTELSEEASCTRYLKN